MMKSYTKKIKAGLMTLLLGLSPTIYGQYCTFTTSNTGDYISGFETFGGNPDISNLNNGQGTTSQGYSDFTSMSVGVYETQQVDFTITAGSSGTYGYSVFIDWDNNQTFDPSEKVWGTTSYENSPQMASFVVPMGQAVGQYRMRIVIDWLNSTPGACTGNYAEAEDYTVDVIAPPSCLPPQNLMVSNVTNTTVDFGWTNATPATEWEVEYGAIGFALGSGTNSNTTNNPYTAAITQGNEYDFYVRAICAVGDTSFWSGPYSMKYCEVSTSYGEYLTEISSAGAIQNISYTASSQPIGSYADETTQSFESFESQVFDINTTYSSGSNGVSIYADWNNDMTFDATELVATQAGTNASQTLSFQVPSGTPIGDYRVRIRGQWGSSVNPPACGNVNYGSTVDFTLTVVAPPSCLPPSALNTSNITATSVDLGWQENNGATTWNIEWGTVGFTQGGANGNLETGVTSNPYTIAIQPNSTYEFYVQTDCGGGDLSAWAGPYQFTNEYCFPSYSYSTEYLSVIETNGALNDVSHTAAAFPTPNGYTDETAQTLQVYETLTFDLNTAYSPSSYSYVVRVWVDWNNDFVFDHPSEMISSVSGGPGSFTQQITVPQGTPVGTYRVRVRGEYGTGSDPMPCSIESWGSAADFTLEVVSPPSCLPPMDIDTVSVSQTSVELSWNELNTNVSNWMIEYGPTGFVNGNGTEVNATSNPFTVTGLSPSTNYDFYVRSDCGGGDTSYWRGPYSVYTDCGIAVAPFYEGFNNGVQPQCWENISSDPSSLTNNFWLFDAQGDYEAANNGKAAGTFTKSDGSTPNPDSMMLITPEIDISQLTTPYLSFEWYSNNGNYPGDNVPFIIEVFDGTSWHLLDTLQGDNPEWQFVNYDLSAYVGNNIQIRFMTNQTTTTNYAYYNDILLDEVRVDDCITLGGQDGTVDVCRLDGEINLDDNIITKPNGTGIWSFPNEPNYLVDDTIFNYSLLPAGTHEVYYVERYVCYDTTVATINVFDASSAGLDGADTVCKNEPIDLYGTLGGNADFGGDWYDFTNTLLPNSQPKAQAIPGEYNYVYIADNGVCPADTAVVTISVKGDCDWLSVGDEILKELSVYPNPATSQLNIVNPSNASSLKIEMLDMNGRTVLVENKALNNASEATLAIEHLEKGVYTLRVYNEEGQKTFKVVKQ